MPVTEAYVAIWDAYQGCVHKDEPPRFDPLDNPLSAFRRPKQNAITRGDDVPLVRDGR